MAQYAVFHAKIGNTPSSELGMKMAGCACLVIMDSYFF
jgi:hypothetical protein